MNTLCKSTFIRAAAIAFGSACALPLLLLATFSVARWRAYPELWPSDASLSAWRRLGGGAEGLGGSLLVSLALATVVATAGTAAGFLTSRVIAYHRWRGWLLFLAYVPFVLSPVILGVCLLHVAVVIGVSGSFAGVAAGQFIFAYAFEVVLFSGFWSAETRSFEELALTLGGTPAQAFGRAVLPLARGILLVGLFQAFLLSWFDYGLVLVIGSGRVQTLTVRVFEYLGAGNVPLASVSACLLVVPPIVLLCFNKRFLFSRL